MAKKGKGINIFRNVPKAQPNRTQFPIGHECTFDGDFGNAYPVFCQEVLPGDTWHIYADHFSRLAPMPAPVMHKFDVRFHWFYVPMRLLWDDFEDWMTGGRTGTWREENPDAFPLFDLSTVAGSQKELQGTLFDFLGVNTASDGSDTDRAIRSGTFLPFMPVTGYFLIFNFFFRDQNVKDEVPIPTTSGIVSGQDFYNLFTSVQDNKGIFKVAWDKDYFTSATLSPQRGPQVYVPLGSTASIITDTDKVATVAFNEALSTSLLTVSSEQAGVVGLNARVGSYGGATLETEYGTNASISPSNFAVPLERVAEHLSADLSTSPGAAVDDVRESFALQRFFERMQVIGSRFSEFLRGIWGTNAGDSRLQMPEYLGTWTNPFMINNVSNTTGTAENPQGGYAGNGMSSQVNQPITKNFPEYGYLYCMYIAMPRNGYQQGLAPIFTRKDWLDFANPYFEHIGEQPIKIKELYFDPSKTEVENDAIFGYQSQYANYKFIASHSHGSMKQSLNFWHANRIFGSSPTLSDTFIEYQPSESTDRVFVAMDAPKFTTQITFGGYVERNLSAYATPRII